MTVRVRGIYATALTAALGEVVQASAPIERRFEESFAMEPATVTVETTDDRQGLGVHGEAADVAETVSTLRSTGLDTLVWRATLPRGGVFAGEVVETLGSGALVECASESGAETSSASVLSDIPRGGDSRGFLPYSKTARRIEEGDRLRVQVAEPRPPWDSGRPVLDTTVRIEGGLATLVRGSTASDGPELADILPADPPSGWGIDWAPRADDADLEALSAVVETLGERARALDEGLSDVESPGDAAPRAYHRPGATCWIWFGRDSRFTLDEKRRGVTETMPGHHRIKAATAEASAAVDFVESICGETNGSEFPFGVVTEQFGPREGDRVGIGHGKPDGRLIDLGTGEVTERTEEGKVTVRRELSSRGTYDALGTDREHGDVAVTKFQEGRWWYPTVYRSESGESKGTYVNVCTPVEVFPETVRYVDLHVDVIKHPDGTVKQVDGDELDAAVDAGQVPEALAKKARTVAQAVENAFD